jgi:hypothetical protein
MIGVASTAAMKMQSASRGLIVAFAPGCRRDRSCRHHVAVACIVGRRPWPAQVVTRSSSR